MRRELAVFIVLLSIFLAIGCADTGDEGEADEGVTPAEEVDEEAPEAGEGGANVERITPAEEPVVPAEEPAAPVEEETPELPIGSGENIEVAIEDNAFNPATVNISTGDTVRWTNLDTASHTVTGTGASFGSEVLNEGDSYEFLFTDAGTYDYYCSIHPEMRGTVVVEEEAD
ncbi:cupredoxin domain-containing protein [Methanosarcina sp.]|uniref:cupredoxin domain-containing protein n=1 Tax=Methanosarcina sp. TaxID=2213 RepID=UPI003C7449FF